MSRFARRLSLSLLVAILGGSAVRAQRSSDPQSSFEPRSGPGAGQKFLEKLVGEWDVAKTFYPRSGDPVRSKGSCHQFMINEGRFLESEFVFEGSAGKTTGLGIIGFEPESDRFTSVWVDSRSTRMSIRRSEAPFDGSEIVLFGRSLESGSSTTTGSRTVTRLEDGGRRILHRQYVPGPDGKEHLIMELSMTRR